MPTATAARRAVARLGEEIQEQAWTLGRDKKAERRKRLAWMAINAALGAAFTLGARRFASRLWLTLTGEKPPAKR